jgi:hypothetical protein
MGGQKTQIGAATVKTAFALLRAAYMRKVKEKAIPAVPWEMWRPTGRFGAATRELVRALPDRPAAAYACAMDTAVTLRDTVLKHEQRVF